MMIKENTAPPSKVAPFSKTARRWSRFGSTFFLSVPILLHRFRQTVAICLVLPVRRPSDNCQMSQQTSVNSNQTSVRQVPHIHQTCTICPPDIYCAICTADDHQTYTRHPPPICQMYGICLMYMWYLSDRCLVGVDRCLVRHLTGILQSSDNHLTGSTRQIATVWRKRWCSGYCGIHALVGTVGYML